MDAFSGGPARAISPVEPSLSAIGGGLVVDRGDLSGQDQRRFRRFEISIPMRFVLVSGEDRRRSSRFYSTNLWDIGLRGISLVTPVLTLDNIHFFYNSIPTLRNRILMQILLPGKHGTVTALGHAIHSRTLQTSERKAYLVGIHFLQISESHGARLRAFLDEVGKKTLSEEANS